MNASPSASTDPYGERRDLPLRRQLPLLGGTFEFRTDDPGLLELVDQAYLGLPAIGLLEEAPSFLIELIMVDGPDLPPSAIEPPAPQMFGGAGFVGARVEGGSLALACAASRSGLVCLTPALLRFAYHARYELLEFVVFTLASRAQGLVPLHAGCVGLGERAALLVGESGAGKSTLSLLAMQAGLDFLTEDASFVAPDARVLGISNFLHLRFDALRFLEAGWRARAATSPVIRRRSGVEKYELDLRGGWARIATQAPRLTHVVFVTPEAKGAGPLLRALPSSVVQERLYRSQPYAIQQPNWQSLQVLLPKLQGWELRRAEHPGEAASALHDLLRE